MKSLENPVKLSLPELSTGEILRHYGSLIPGHVAFRSQEHGNGYVEKMHFLQHPEALKEIAARLADLFNDLRNEIDVVVGPAHMGTVLAYAVASHLKKPFTLTYQEMRTGNGIITGSTHFHRAAAPQNGDKLLFVDDFVSTGNDLRRNVAFIRSKRLMIAGVGLIGMRQIDLSDLDVNLRVLHTIDFWKVPIRDCPLCEQNIPLVASNIRE